VLSSGYLCRFKDLTITAVLLDDIMARPDEPELELLVEMETKSLRDTRDILAQVLSAPEPLTPRPALALPATRIASVPPRAVASPPHIMQHTACLTSCSMRYASCGMLHAACCMHASDEIA
jgi:hypothetical protein